MFTEKDNFEALNNVELKAKCKEHGLPNIPVTDSTREVLINKLRASIGDGENLPESSATAKQNLVSVSFNGIVISSQSEVKVAIENPAPIMDRPSATEPVVLEEDDEDSELDATLTEDDYDEGEDLVLAAAAERAEQGNRLVSSTQPAVKRNLSLTKSSLIRTIYSPMSAASVAPIAERRDSKDVKNSHVDSLNAQPPKTFQN